MSWRSVLVTRNSHLSLEHNALAIRQGEDTAHVHLEDMAVLVLDHPQITLTGRLLSACADGRIVVVTLGDNHLPNGLFFPLLPHSRALKIMRAQLRMTEPLKKRLQQVLIRQKISNQAQVLAWAGHDRAAGYLRELSTRVRSGDPDNREAIAAQCYFRELMGGGFRRDEPSIVNGALNFGYAVVRSAIARSLICYGFLPALGIFHRSEQNAFNLADDLIEPYRPLVDLLIVTRFIKQSDKKNSLDKEDKARLIGVLGQDISLSRSASERCSVLAAIDATVISLQASILNKQPVLTLPQLAAGEIVLDERAVE